MPSLYVSLFDVDLRLLVAEEREEREGGSGRAGGNWRKYRKDPLTFLIIKENK